MPNQPLDEPTTKITLNVYTADLETLRRREGYGWSKVLRSLLRRWAKGQRVIEETQERERFERWKRADIDETEFGGEY